MFGPSSVFENSIWGQFRIGQEKSMTKPSYYWAIASNNLTPNPL